MAPSYNHTSNGVNLANYRLLTQSARTAGNNGSYRAPYDWNLESQDQMGAGAAENRMSTTLRDASVQLQATTNALVANDINTVDRTLITKLTQTEQLKGMLETCLAEVVTEIAELLSTKKRLEERGGKVQNKMGVNSQRLQVAASRPNWRAEIEDGDAAGSSTGRSSAPSTSTPSSSGSSSSSSSGAATSAPSQPGPVVAAELLRSQQPEPQMAQQQQQQQQAWKPMAAEGGRGDPASLPTFDLVEFLTDPAHQASAFGTLAATSAILSVLCCVEPEAILDLALPKPEAILDLALPKPEAILDLALPKALITATTAPSPCLASLEYGYSIIFGSAILSDQVDIDAASLSNLGGSLLIASFAMYTYSTAKK
ncbi:hypothetical protein TSOC_008065 [Tetrabaena socialis]|uniref:Uncharacterized protein n=1 Tax=Tetrabaena socialis TaxID=47790 RepID=A0A2J7ZZF9_9CHLO|nr:hypothetical protein TSOC_008065 [Tetrabaena socialis]|eukprot:PNH05659.1 hypothetical protein TSOC_008065 [Tetrabaena socialis]